MDAIAACFSLLSPWKVAVANIPTRIIPGFWSSSRTFAVRKIRVQNGSDIADPSSENAIGISIQLHIRVLTDTHILQIVFVDIADYPNVRQVGNRERICRCQTLYA